MPPENKRLLVPLLACICFLVYSNSLSGPFISDDIPSIARNWQLLHPLRFWDSPLTLLNSFNYLLAGANPFLYHLTNVLLHALNSILVFFVLRIFFCEEAGLLGALLFAVHPVHTEAVSWISGRTYMLVAFFTLAVILLYAGSTDPKKGFRKKRYFLSFLLFSYTLIPLHEFRYLLIPLLIVLFDLSLARYKNWKLWLPFFLAAVVKLALSSTVLMQRPYILASQSGASGPAWNNPLFTFAHSLFSNFALLVWPLRLTLYHEPILVPRQLLYIEVFFALLIIFSLPFIFKREKAVFFGIVFFIVSISPTFSPLPVSWMIAERYLYLPALTLSVLAAFCYDKYAGRSKRLKDGMLIMLIAVSVFFILRTVIRNEDWADSGRFWRKTLEASPESVTVHIKMADVYRSEGNFKASLSELHKSIALRPEDPLAYFNLGNTYAEMGENDKAASAFLKALLFRPDFGEAYFNLGNLSFIAGRKEEAAAYYRKALKINPGIPEAYLNLGAVYESLGEREEAVKIYKQAIDAYPHLAPALLKALKPHRNP